MFNHRDAVIYNTFPDGGGGVETL